MSMNTRARNSLVNGLGAKELNRIPIYQSDKETLEVLQRTHEGNQSKKLNDFSVY